MLIKKGFAPLCRLPDETAESFGAGQVVDDVIDLALVLGVLDENDGVFVSDGEVF